MAHLFFVLTIAMVLSEASMVAADDVQIETPRATESFGRDKQPQAAAIAAAAVPANASCSGLSDPLQLSTAGGTVPDMAIDRFGRAHVVWSGANSSIWYAQVGPDGIITVPATKVYDTARTTFPRIAVDTVGDAHIIATTTGLTPFILYLKLHEGSRALINAFSMWPPNTVFDWESDNWPSIDIDPGTQLPVIAAEVHLQYTIDFGGGPVIRYYNNITVERLDATGQPIYTSRWYPYFINNTANIEYRAEYPELAADSAGRQHCVWLHRDPSWSGNSIGYAYQSGNTWIEIANNRNVSGLTGGPEIARSATGLVEIVWSTTASAVIWQEMNHDGVTMIDDFAVSQPAAQASRPQVTAGFGNVFFGWADAREGANQIYSRNVLNPTLERNVTCNSAGAFNHALAARDRDYLAYAWQDSSSGTAQIWYRVQAPIDLIALEVIQTIQNWSNNVPLVEGKTTYARAHVQLSGLNTNPVEVAGARLHGTTNGIPLPDSPLMPMLSGVHASTNALEKRGAFTNTVNFPLPARWLHGSVNLRFDWTNGMTTNGINFREPPEAGGIASNGEVNVTFQRTATPRLKFWAVNWVDSNGKAQQVSDPTLKDLAPRLTSIYPVAQVDVRFSVLDWKGTVPPKEEDVNKDLQWKRYRDFCFSFLGCDRIYYGAIASNIHGPVISGLAADIPGVVSSGYVPDDTFVEGRHTHSHEIGHNLGRQHAVHSMFGPWVDCSNPTIVDPTATTGVCCECADSTAPDFPDFYPLPGLGLKPALGPLAGNPNEAVYGFDKLALQAGLEPVVDPTNYFEMMSYCSVAPLDLWISQYTYQAIWTNINRTFNPTGSAPFRQQTEQDFLIIRGGINFANDTVDFLPFGMIRTAVVPPALPVGDYVLQLLDRNGNLVGEIDFQPSHYKARGPEPRKGAFIIPVPANPVIARAAVRHNGQELASRSTSAHSPSVVVVSPNGGEVLGAEDRILVRWNGNDPDNDPLTYLIEFSANGGAEWETIAVDLKGNSYEVQSQSLQATAQGLIRVVVSDGFLSSSDQSDTTFSVANHRPTVTISSPRANTLFSGNRQVIFEASSIDVEDGAVTNLQWNSSLDGFLGSGPVLAKNNALLTEGHHQITVTTTDIAGATNAASIGIQIVHGEIPVLLASRVGTNVTLSWPISAANFMVQAKDNPSSGAWLTLTNSLTIIGDRNTLVVPATEPSRFYRLSRP